MENHHTKESYISCPKKSWNRDEVACKIVDFNEAKLKHSQREFAKENNIPRTTLQAWLGRKDSLDSCSELADFFESPIGTAFLHRMIVGAHYEFCKKGTASIHNVGNYLKLLGLDPFVTSSYTTQNRVSNKMDRMIVEFGDIESEEMSRHMPPKKISLAEDETFHPEICLVGLPT